MAARTPKVVIDRAVIVAEVPVNPPKTIQTGTFTTVNMNSSIKVVKVDLASPDVSIRIGDTGAQYFGPGDLRDAALFFSELADVLDEIETR